MRPDSLLRSLTPVQNQTMRERLLATHRETASRFALEIAMQIEHRWKTLEATLDWSAAGPDRPLEEGRAQGAGAGPPAQGGAAMKHLILCREMPPASGGSAPTWTTSPACSPGPGETVHVIGQLWEGAERPIEERNNGRLVIHRLPFEDWEAPRRGQPRFDPKVRPLDTLFRSDFPARCFAWQAALLAERLIEREGIDLVESQEYEAPLSGSSNSAGSWGWAHAAGPLPGPPAHLHSPTEFIARHNEWEPDRPGAATAMRLERESIQWADALLCPSRFLAGQAEELYRLPAGAVQVIPLPPGRRPPTGKGPRGLGAGGRSATWAGWRGARGSSSGSTPRPPPPRAVPDARFEFIGANVLETPEMRGEEVVERRIPRTVRGRFRFHGGRPRAALRGFLAGARIAVVPSRWENFPNACVEAMASGLPVIATRQGGMAEMIADGESGWLVETADPGKLAGALERALATPPERLREMGRRAAEDVAFLCANDRVLAAHLAFRAEVAARGAVRSRALPEGDLAALRDLAAGRVPRAPRPPLPRLYLLRPLRKAIRSPRRAAIDAWKMVGRYAGRVLP